MVSLLLLFAQLISLQPLLWIILAYVLSAVLRRLMQRFDLYRLVWHRALFDFAIFVCLLGGVVYLSEFLP